MNGNALTASTASVATNVSFGGITTGTSTGTLRVGTGSSLSTSGSGTITATAAPASGITGTTLASNVVKSSLTTVGTITSGTWNAGAVTTNSAATGLNVTVSAANDIADFTNSFNAVTVTIDQYGTFTGTANKASLATTASTAAAAIPGRFPVSNPGSLTVDASQYSVIQSDGTGGTVNLNGASPNQIIYVYNFAAPGTNAVTITTGGIAEVVSGGSWAILQISSNGVDVLGISSRKRDEKTRGMTKRSFSMTRKTLTFAILAAGLLTGCAWAATPGASGGTADIITDTIDQGGKRVTDANYTVDQSIGGITGTSDGGNFTMLHGYIAQLIEPTPVITSGPTATPNPADVNQIVTFSVAVPAGLTVSWDFGDTTGNNTNQNHGHPCLYRGGDLPRGGDGDEY